MNILNTELITNIYANLFGSFLTIFPGFLAEKNDASVGFGLKMIGVGLAIGIGAVGSCLGQGLIGQGACLAIGRNPDANAKIRSSMIIAAGICESGSIYALVIAILIIFIA